MGWLRGAIARRRWCERLVRVNWAGYRCRVLLGREVQVRHWLERSTDNGKRSIHGLSNWAVRRCWRCRVGRSLGCQTWASSNKLRQFIQRDSVLRIDLKDTLKNAIKLIRNRKNGLQEVPVPYEGPESGVIHRGTLPWIPAAGQVDQNHTKRPDIIRSRSVACIRLRVGLLAFW